MRKIVFISLILLFISSFFISPNSFSQDEVTGSPKPSPSVVDYNLPYPGILPGNILYPVKVLRDRLVEFFISDPSKKAEFYLLQGDKHLSSAILLVSESSSNYSLAESTISKGENYMEGSLGQISTIKAEQQDPKDFLDRLSTSLKKHQEVINSLEKSAPADVKDKLELDAQRAKDLEKKVNSIKSNLK